MAKIHYFQRYSSPENTVTNNTLQLLARIYSNSPSKAALFLTELTGTSIDIGPEIRQQERDGSSVPDGAILQRSFKILIESKVGSPASLPQLVEHAKGFGDEEQKILLLLTIQSLSQQQLDHFSSTLRREQPGVQFANVTYEQVCRATRALYQDFEYEMKGLVEDYDAYCNDSGLFDQSPHLMRIVPCGNSLEINLRHGIYFHPADRGYTRHAYTGVYKWKTVHAIWKNDSVFDVTLDGETLHKVLVEGRSTDEYDGRIRSIIRDAWDECSYTIEKGHRFFCGAPCRTDFVKVSPYGIQGARFINLRDTIGDFSNTEEAATKLRGQRWE